MQSCPGHRILAPWAWGRDDRLDRETCEWVRVEPWILQAWMIEIPWLMCQDGHVKTERLDVGGGGGGGVEDRWERTRLESKTKKVYGGEESNHVNTVVNRPFLAFSE